MLKGKAAIVTGRGMAMACLALVGALAISACASSQQWERAGLLPGQREADIRACRHARDAELERDYERIDEYHRLSGVRLYDMGGFSSPAGLGSDQEAAQARASSRCMKAKGYALKELRQ